MKKFIVGANLLFVLISLSQCPVYAVEIPTPSIPAIADVDRTFLPDQFPVYINGHDLAYQPTVDHTEKFIPTNNGYKQSPGCYVACYSANPAQSIYSPTDNTYLIGQIRVAGTYDGKNCKPIGFENKDISKIQKFAILCSSSFSVCKGNACWASGSTGNWITS